MDFNPIYKGQKCRKKKGVREEDSDKKAEKKKDRKPGDHPLWRIANIAIFIFVVLIVCRTCSSWTDAYVRVEVSKPQRVSSVDDLVTGPPTGVAIIRPGQVARIPTNRKKFAWRVSLSGHSNPTSYKMTCLDGSTATASVVFDKVYQPNERENPDNFYYRLSTEVVEFRIAPGETGPLKVEVWVAP